jgi:hypothetical protein
MKKTLYYLLKLKENFGETEFYTVCRVKVVADNYEDPDKVIDACVDSIMSNWYGEPTECMEEGSWYENADGSMSIEMFKYKEITEEVYEAIADIVHDYQFDTDEIRKKVLCS